MLISIRDMKLKLFYELCLIQIILNLISLINYKNHEHLKVNFSDDINCFLGKNGVGKTNLLDAIYYLSFCKSYYSNVELNNIRYGESFFMIQGDYTDDNNNKCVVSSSLQNKQKKVQLNNKKYDENLNILLKNSVDAYNEGI